MRPELERVVRTCLAVAREEAAAREALRVALDSGSAEAVAAVARAFVAWRDLGRATKRAILRDLGVTVLVSRPMPRVLVVEAVELRAITR